MLFTRGVLLALRTRFTGKALTARVPSGLRRDKARRSGLQECSQTNHHYGSSRSIVPKLWNDR